ncbi:hypothetical protein Tco_0156561 [Tanacetum coccineum]
MVVQDQEEMGEGSAIPTDPHHTPTIIQPSPQPQKKQKPRKPKRKDTQIPQSSGPTEHVADEAVYKELDDSLVRAATTASSLEVEQDSGTKPNLQQRVLEFGEDKAIQHEEIVSLKRRVKKLEQKKRSRTYRLKKLYKVSLTARMNDIFDVNTLTVMSVSRTKVAVNDVNLTVEEVTLAQPAQLFVLATNYNNCNNSNFQGKEMSFTELGTSTTTTISSQPSHAKVQDKEGRKPKDLKNKSLDSIQKMFDKAFKEGEYICDLTEQILGEEVQKEAGTELEHRGH